MPIAVSACCAWLFYSFGDLTAQVFTKIASDGLLLFFIFSFRRQELYYYYNLHFTNRSLVLGYLVIDLLVFSLWFWLLKMAIWLRACL